MLIDLYDTLVSCDFTPLHALVAERLGVSLAVVVAAYDTTRRSRGTGHYPSPETAMGSIVETCGREATTALVESLVAIERDFFAREVRLYPDSLDTVRWLRGSGVRTALVSNCSPASGGVVDDLELASEMDAIVLSFEVGALKPAPAIFRAALERLDTSPSDTWFIDDQASYCDGARRLGMRTLQIVRADAGTAGRGGRRDDDLGPKERNAAHPIAESFAAARGYLEIS